MREAAEKPATSVNRAGSCSQRAFRPPTWINRLSLWLCSNRPLPHRYLSRCPRRRFRREPPRATLQSRRSMFEVAIKAAQENAGSGPLTAGRANAPFFGPIRPRGRSHETIYAAAPNARSSGRQPLGGTRTRRTCRLSQPHRKGAPGGHPREGSDIVHSEDQPAHTPRHRSPASAGGGRVRER